MIIKDPDYLVVDVSSHEYPVRFDIAPQARYVVLRASYQYLGARARYEDSSVNEYAAAARAAGCKLGLYHFLTPNGIAEQAALFLGVWRRLGGVELPPVVDVEVDLPRYYAGAIGNSTWAMHVKTFIDLVSVGTGRTPMIYTSENYWNNFVCSRTLLGWKAPSWTVDYDLWVAQYPNEPDGAAGPRALPAGWGRWAMWQYTDKGRTNGYWANDYNVVSEWYKEVLGAGEEPEPPAPGGDWPEYLRVINPQGVEKRYNRA